MWSTFILTGNLEPINGIKQGGDRSIPKGNYFLLVIKLKVLLAANFGRKKNSEAKKRKIAAEYVKLCGYKKGGDRSSKGQHGLLTIKEIATQLGTSEKSLKRALRIENKLTDSMKQLLDDGVISQTVAADVGGLSKKVGLRIKELERIYGIKQGRPDKLPNNSVVKTQKDIASEMGMDA